MIKKVDLNKRFLDIDLKILDDESYFSLTFIKAKEDYFIFEDECGDTVDLEKEDSNFFGNGERFELIKPFGKNFKTYIKEKE